MGVLWAHMGAIGCIVINRIWTSDGRNHEEESHKNHILR